MAQKGQGPHNKRCNLSCYLVATPATLTCPGHRQTGNGYMANMPRFRWMVAKVLANEPDDQLELLLIVVAGYFKIIMSGCFSVYLIYLPKG